MMMLQNYNDLNPHVQALVRNCIDNACSYCNDMLLEEDTAFSEYTFNDLCEQAEQMFIFAIDQEHGKVEVPTMIRLAIKEFVRTNVGFAIIICDN